MSQGRRNYFLCQKSITKLPSWFVNCRKEKQITILSCHFEQTEKEEEVNPDAGFDFSPIFAKFGYEGNAPETPSFTPAQVAAIKKKVDFTFFTSGAMNTFNFRTDIPVKSALEVALCMTEKLVDASLPHFLPQGIYGTAEELAELKALLEHLIQLKAGCKLIYKITGAVTTLPKYIFGYVLYYLMNNFEIKRTFKQAEFLEIVRQVQAGVTRMLLKPDKKSLMYDVIGIMNILHHIGESLGSWVISKYDYDYTQYGKNHWEDRQEKIGINLFKQYELLAQRCIIERYSDLGEFKKELDSDEFFNNLVFQKMNEAMSNPQGLFGDANTYKFYDAKRVMGWVFENFFDISVGYGRPSMYNTDVGNIMLSDGTTPHGPDYSVLHWFAWAIDPYKNYLTDLTDQDLDFLCQVLLKAIRSYDPKGLLGMVDSTDRYVDETAVRYWPNNVVFSMKAMLSHYYPSTHRYYYGLMSHSHPLVANIAFEALNGFVGLGNVTPPDSAISTYFSMALSKIDEILKLVNDENLMSNAVIQAMRVAKTDGVFIATNKNNDSDTQLLDAMKKNMAGQGKEITLHSNVISQERYDDNFVCYANESSAPKTFPVHLESMDSVEVWFKDGEDKVIDLNNPEKKVKFRVEMLLETND